jgi:hypothetical protein
MCTDSSNVRVVEWLGEADVQIGDPAAPPPVQVSPFLAGFVSGLSAHEAVRDAALLEVDASSPVRCHNPTRRVSFRFRAESREAAERLAREELRDAGLRAGVEALHPSFREFGWMISINIDAAR